MTVEVRNSVFARNTVEIHQVSDSVLYAWGENNRGQIGNKLQTNSSSPIQIGTGLEWSETYVKSISNGIYFTALTKTNGTLWVWGDNTHSNLGTSDTVSRSSPTQVGTSNNWAMVKCGVRFMVGVKKDGTLWTWGRALNGYLGSNQTSTNRNSPTQVGIDRGWWGTEETLSAAHHVGAIKGDGTLWMWGVNTRGQVGDGTNLNRSSPVQIGFADRWSQVSCGASATDNNATNTHTAAIRRDGTLWLWGENYRGCLGDNTKINKNSPVQVLGGGTWSYVSCGYQNTIAIKSDGTVWGWGRNDNGRLGIGNNINVSSPVQITASTWQSGFDKFSTRFDSSFAINKNKALHVFGGGFGGQLGYGLVSDKLSPVPIGYEKEWTRIYSGMNVNYAFARNLPVNAEKVIDWDGINYFGDTTWPDASTSINNANLNGISGSNSCVGFLEFGGGSVAIAQKYRAFVDITSNKNLTLEVWFRTIKNQGKIVGFEQTNLVGGGGTYDRHLYVGNDGGLYFGLNDIGVGLKTVKYGGGGKTGPLTVTNGAWHHAVATFDGSNMRLYVNGNLIQQTACTNAGSSDGYWRVGGFKLNGWLNASDSYFWGQIASVKIYNYALNGTDVLANFNSTKSFYPQEIFTYTDAEQYLSIPYNRAKITVTARGGRGFRGSRYDFLGTYIDGGTGGCIQATFNVSPNSFLNVVVGAGDTNVGLSQGGGKYGFGARSDYNQSSLSDTNFGGAGGGLSGLFAGDPANPSTVKYIVAGGGGGGGMQALTVYGQGNSPIGGNGGDQNNPNGTNPAGNADYFSNSATGGSNSSVGRGGKLSTNDGGLTYCCGNLGYDGGPLGYQGSTASVPDTIGVQGGRPGSGIGIQAQSGGGGGGWNGGGGGATSSSNRSGTKTNGSSMGGAGGSSYFEAPTFLYGYGNQCGPGSLVVCYDDCSLTSNRTPFLTAPPTTTPTPTSTQPTPTPSGTGPTPTPTPSPTPSPTIAILPKGPIIQLQPPGSYGTNSWDTSSAQFNTFIGPVVFASVETNTWVPSNWRYSYIRAEYKYIDANEKLWATSYYHDEYGPRYNNFGQYQNIFPDKNWKYVSCIQSGKTGNNRTTVFGITTDGNLWSWGYPLVYDLNADVSTITNCTSSPVQQMAGVGRWKKVVSCMDEQQYRSYFALNENGQVWGIGTTTSGLFGPIDVKRTSWKALPITGFHDDITSATVDLPSWNIGYAGVGQVGGSRYAGILYLLKGGKILFMGYDQWRITYDTPYKQSITSPVQISSQNWTSMFNQDLSQGLFAISTTGGLSIFKDGVNGGGVSPIQINHSASWKAITAYEANWGQNFVGAYGVDVNNNLYYIGWTTTSGYSPVMIQNGGDWISFGSGQNDAFIGIKNLTIPPTPTSTPTPSPSPTPSPTPSSTPTPTVTCPTNWTKFDGIYYQNGVDKNASAATVASMTNGSIDEVFVTTVYFPRTTTEIPYIRLDLRCERLVEQITIGTNKNNTMIGNYPLVYGSNLKVYGATNANSALITKPDLTKQTFLFDTGDATTAAGLRTFNITPANYQFIYIYQDTQDWLCVTEFFASGGTMVTPTPSPSSTSHLPTPTPTPTSTLSNHELWEWGTTPQPVNDINAKNVKFLHTNSWNNNLDSISGYEERKLVPLIWINKDGDLYMKGDIVIRNHTFNNILQVPNTSFTKWKFVTASNGIITAISQNGVAYTWAATTNILFTYPYSPQANAIAGPSNIRFKYASRTIGNLALIAEDNTLWVTGSNNQCNLGLGYYSSFESSLICQNAFTQWSQVAVSENFMLGIRTDGTLWGWGRNGASAAFNTGYLGIGNFSEYASSPVQSFDKGNTWKKVAISDGNAYGIPFFRPFCVGLKTDGTLWLWGAGIRYLKTSNMTENQFNTIDKPNQIIFGTDDSNWNDVFAGPGSIRAAKKDGTLWLYGNNTGNAAGNGDNSFQRFTSPVQIAIKDNKWITSTTNKDSYYAGFSQLALRVMPTAGPSPSFTPSPTPTPSPSPTPSPTRTPLPTATPFAMLFSWGRNNTGQLGVGTIINASSPLQALGGLTNWNSITSNSSSSSSTFGGIKSDGTLWMWGTAANGILGNSTITNKSSPVQVTGGGNWSGVAIGSTAVAAIKNDSSLWTWGINTDGVLGANVVVTTTRSSPVSLATTTWRSVAAGLMHFAATKTDNTLWVWGRNTNGQLGNGNILAVSSPTQITGSYSKVVCGETATAAIKTDGTLWIWGNGGYGVMGNSASLGRSSPVQLGIETNWTDIAISRDFVYALRGGNLLTWGRNTNGQLGSNSVINRSSPVQIATGIGYIGVGQTTGYYTDTTGRLWSSGQNSYGQVGRNSVISVSSPVQTIINDTNWFRICGNIQSAFGLRYIPGPTPTSTAATPTPTPSPTIIPKGLYVWGRNVYGELGINNTSVYEVSSPILVIGGSNWTYVDKGSNFYVGIKGDGTLWTWGYNNVGQCGDRTNINRSSPVQTITLGSNWARCYTKDNHVMAIKKDGTLWGWGYNAYRQVSNLGAGYYVSSPVQIAGTNWLQASTGLYTTLAVKTDGTLWGWGWNQQYIIGLPLLNNYYDSPSQIGTSTDWISAHMADYNGGSSPSASFAIKKTGTLWAVGSNSYGILGLGDTISRSVFTQVGTGTNWKSIIPNVYQPGAMFGLKQDNTIWSWGNTIRTLYSGGVPYINYQRYSSPIQQNWSNNFNTFTLANAGIASVGRDTFYATTSTVGNGLKILSNSNKIYSWPYGFAQNGTSSTIYGEPVLLPNTSWGFMGANGGIITP
jgi:alpha-tubulin suppressor-like RCC1 family protein